MATLVPAEWAHRVIKLEDNYLAGRIRHGWTGNETADAIVWNGCPRRVVNVEEIVRSEIRIERDTEQPVLTHRVGVHREIRGRAQHPVFDHAYLAALLANEYAAIRQQLHARDARHAGRHFRRDKAIGQLLRVRGHLQAQENCENQEGMKTMT